MKKRNKLATGIIIFLILCVLVSFIPDSEKSDDAIAETPTDNNVETTETNISTDEEDETDILEKEIEEDVPVQFNVDWDACIDEVKTELTNEEFFSYVKDIDIEFREDEKQIVFMAALGDSTDPEIALDFGDTMLRRFNSSAQAQDRTVKGGSKDYYGSLYDSYSVLVGIAPLSKVDNQKEWFVYDAVTISAHTKLKLQKYYR